MVAHLAEHLVWIGSGALFGLQQHFSVGEDNGHGFGRGVLPSQLFGSLVLHLPLLHHLVREKCGGLFLGEICTQSAELLVCLIDGIYQGGFLLAGNLRAARLLREQGRTEEEDDEGQ